MKIQGATIYGRELEPVKTSVSNEKEQVPLDKTEDTKDMVRYDTYQASKPVPETDVSDGVIYDAAFLKYLGIDLPDATNVRVIGDPKQIEALQKEYDMQKAFEKNSNQQWKIFQEQLESSGVYKGMSEETRAAIEQKLKQITASMDSFQQYNQKFGGEHQDLIYVQVTNKQNFGSISYQDWFYMSKEQWMGQLTQTKKELEDFCSAYLMDEQKDDFSHLIDRFYQRNEEVLKEYHALGEDSAKSMLFEAMQQKDSLEELASDLERLLYDFLQQMIEQEEQNLQAPSRENKEQTYIDVLKAFFSQVASSQGVSVAALQESSDDKHNILQKLSDEMWKEEQAKRIQAYYDSVIKVCKNGVSKEDKDSLVQTAQETDSPS